MAAVTRTPAVAAVVRYRRTVFGSSPSWAAIRFFGRPAPRSRRTSRISIIVTSRYIHASWPRARPGTGDLYRAVRRKGGMVLKNLTPEGGKVLKKSSGKGPYVLRTDTDL